MLRKTSFSGTKSRKRVSEVSNQVFNIPETLRTLLEVEE